MASIHYKKSKSGKKIYHIVFRVCGKQKWRKAGSDYALAKKIKLQIENDINAGNWGVLNNTILSFKKFIKEKYLPFKKSPSFSKRTYEITQNSCNFIIKFFKDMPLKAVTPEHIHRYISWRSKKVGNRTVNIDLNYINQALSKAVEWGYIARNPYKYGKIGKLYELRKVRYLSMDEIYILLNNCSKWTKSIVIIALNLGLRANEISNLKWEDVDFKRNEVTIQAKHSKNKKQRIIPLNIEATKMLAFLRNNFIDYNNNKFYERELWQMIYVFCDKEGRKIKSFTKSFNRAVKKSGLENVTLHTLRHSFASHHIMSGTSLETVKELMGHSDIKTTLIYTHLSNEHLHKAVKQINLGSHVRYLLDETKSKKVTKLISV
ncbi:tyrosine-type recombinase/integrase [Candidatus Margulisiibacteriota bacterium]